MAKANFHSLIKQELVNRFEDVVKNELREFSSIQKNNEKTFSEIKNNINDIQEKFRVFQSEVKKDSDTIIDKVKSEKLDFIHASTLQLIEINRSFEKIQKQWIQFCEIKENIAQKQDLMILKNNVESQLSKIYVIINDKEKHVYYSISEYIKQIESIKSNHLFFENNIIEKFNKIISDYEEKIKNFEINVEGYLKDLQSTKKKAFIQEKYIEKIMTDLEKLKNEATK